MINYNNIIICIDSYMALYIYLLVYLDCTVVSQLAIYIM